MGVVGADFWFLLSALWLTSLAAMTFYLDIFVSTNLQLPVAAMVEMVVKISEVRYLTSVFMSQISTWIITFLFYLASTWL
ncbi:hypothetical protein Gotur_019590 [Gossypium turneri]